MYLRKKNYFKKLKRKERKNEKSNNKFDTIIKFAK